jgi:hypothetical protein
MLEGPNNQAAIHIAAKTNYLNKTYQYLKNISITEWDIQSAGLSVLKFRKLLPEEELKKLELLDKKTRTIKEGLLQKSQPKIAESIIETLSKVRQGFTILNHIQEENILSIKKDALFLINTQITHPTVKEFFTFRNKNTYTSYILLNKSEFYFNSLTNVLHVKGLPEDSVNKQRNFILKDISGFLKSSEKVSSKTMFILLKNYREKYLSRQLPIETYRELNSGKFRIGDYLIEDVDSDLLNEIDITQNYMNYILPLIQLMI